MKTAAFVILTAIMAALNCGDPKPGPDADCPPPKLCRADGTCVCPSDLPDAGLWDARPRAAR